MCEQMYGKSMLFYPERKQRIEQTQAFSTTLNGNENMNKIA